MTVEKVGKAFPTFSYLHLNNLGRGNGITCTEGIFFSHLNSLVTSRCLFSTVFPHLPDHTLVIDADEVIATSDTILVGPEWVGVDGIQRDLPIIFLCD